MAGNGGQNFDLNQLIAQSYARPDFRLGRWRVGKELGKGGFGVARLAYLDVDVRGESTTIKGVAKLVNPAARNLSQAAHSIQQEIHNLSLLNSRYMAKLLDAGIVRLDHGIEVPYLVMDLIEGESLQNIVNNNIMRDVAGISPRLFKTLATNTLRALKHAHELNVLHLDIKPDNILYSAKDDAFVLIDFGLAVISARDVIQTYVGGTNGFMAPETLEEKTSKAADIYSLGMSYYLALTGINPIVEAIFDYIDKNGPFPKNDLRPWQIMANSVVPDFSLLTADQRTLIEPMLEIDPGKRPSLTKLIALAEQLDLISAPANPDKAQRDPNLDWNSIYLSIKNKILLDGPQRFEISIDSDQNKHVWFKSLVKESKFFIVCPKIKNPLKLSKLGWRNYEIGMMAFELGSSQDPDVIAKAIVDALIQGFELKLPIQVI